MKALSEVRDPELHRDIVSLGMAKDVSVDNGKVILTLNLTTPACPLREKLEEATREALIRIPGVTGVEIRTSSVVFATKDMSQTGILGGVKNVIAVASGKGGVGKSTISVNLAASLAVSGAKVGILDADVYGPNIPHMMGVAVSPDPKGDLIMPSISHGVKVASLGFFYREETPVIWRGPLVAGAVKQLLTQVDWGEIDYLIVDLPPGTGDAALTLAQTVPLAGIVIVTTPQDAALSIAAKALAMFRRLNVPILGVVENMSYFVCPHCGVRSEIFSTGGGKRMAKDQDVDFLGEIPLTMSLREQSDAGVPISVARPGSWEDAIFRDFAYKVAGMVSIVAFSKMKK